MAGQRTLGGLWTHPAGYRGTRITFAGTLLASVRTPAEIEEGGSTKP